MLKNTPAFVFSPAKESEDELSSPIKKAPSTARLVNFSSPPSAVASVPVVPFSGMNLGFLGGKAQAVYNIAASTAPVPSNFMGQYALVREGRAMKKQAEAQEKAEEKEKAAKKTIAKKPAAAIAKKPAAAIADKTEEKQGKKRGRGGPLQMTVKCIRSLKTTRDS